MSDDSDIPPTSMSDEVQYAAAGEITIQVDGTDVKVDSPAKAVVEIKKQVVAYLNKEQQITGTMRKVCIEVVGPIIDSFATRNKDNKVVENGIIVQERKEGGDKYKEMGFEIDSDPANTTLKQAAHIGAEIYWGKDPNRDHPGEEPWRFGIRGFKMHAETLKETAPYWRHQEGYKETEVGPATELKEKIYRVERWETTNHK
ncbi:hypothetical protein F5887DRAFT_676523 [Amanita rubescens]|nr:hypothetical protein F5887DRAFT_676523 [Amanita rubescens]